MPAAAPPPRGYAAARAGDQGKRAYFLQNRLKAYGYTNTRALEGGLFVNDVKVSFAGSAGESSTTDNSLTTGATAFQNFAGMQALNLNTGAGASQNANVSVAVTAGDIVR